MRPEPRPSDGALRLNGLRLRRRGLRLVENLDLEAPLGTTVAIVGPSGAGKTTLLRTVTGAVAPTAGTIIRPQGRLAMVFQEPRLLPWRSALDNVALVTDDRDRLKAGAWLDGLGIADAADVLPAALSGGMRQRVAIARALVCEPRLVLVDEPFSNLDDALAQRLRHDLAAHLSEQPRVTLWVTHDLTEAASVAQTTLVLRGPPDGVWEVVEHGLASPREVADELAGQLRA